MSLTLKLAYGYPKVGASGEQEVVWAGAGDLTLSSDVGAEVAGSAGAALPLIKMLHESFQGKESVVGLGAYTATVLALALALTLTLTLALALTLILTLTLTPSSPSPQPHAHAYQMRTTTLSRP